MTDNTHTPGSNDGFMISYLTLRKAVGILGMALPAILVLGYFIFEKNCTFPPSISHFYYTGMGNYFVGTLCAVSFFMFAYNGHDDKDKIAAKFAGLFALLVAMFPTNFGTYADLSCSRITLNDHDWISYLHYGAATLLFLTLAYFSLILFTKTDEPGKLEGMKKVRNGIYKTCGWVILVCIISIALLAIFPDLHKRFKMYKPTFVFESIALLAFGYSWLIKGETFFKD